MEIKTETTDKNEVKAEELTYFPKIEDVGEAVERVRSVARKTPLEEHERLSEKYEANIWLKREDLQKVRSYKIRGSFNKISSLTEAEKTNGIVCASAGNHAQGVALSCYKLQIKGTIFMPTTTPKQKIRKVKSFGKEYVQVILQGDSFDDAKEACVSFANEKMATIIPPFENEKVIEGQATVAMEVLHQAPSKIDYLFVPIGGGGLCAGMAAVFKYLSPYTKIIGIEPVGAPAMYQSLKEGKVITLDEIETFADGVAVKRVGQLNFDIIKSTIHDMCLVHEGKICETMLELYNEDAIVVEPAGALTIAILDDFKEVIKGKNVVCVVSGGNNDITRTEEVRERALLYRGLKHYFVVNFPQRAGALKDFVNDILGENDDIVFFEYNKSNDKAYGQALVGIEVKRPEDFVALKSRMIKHNFFGEYLNAKPNLFNYLIGN
jgi:threonine dehydratase